MVGELK